MVAALSGRATAAACVCSSFHGAGGRLCSQLFRWLPLSRQPLRLGDLLARIGELADRSTRMRLLVFRADISPLALRLLHRVWNLTHNSVQGGAHAKDA